MTKRAQALIAKIFGCILGISTNKIWCLECDGDFCMLWDLVVLLSMLISSRLYYRNQHVCIGGKCRICFRRRGCWTCWPCLRLDQWQPFIALGADPEFLYIVKLATTTFLAHFRVRLRHLGDVSSLTALRTRSLTLI